MRSVHEVITVGSLQIVFNWNTLNGYDSVTVFDGTGQEIAHDVLTQYEAAGMADFFGGNTFDNS
ncbi:hypothetical protein [Streptomyces smyrnaeus]|uniref:hypothetical protein n=1 Tax=Streptomyces smyrnaeus TaxID=1387713 RepID=UPI00369775C0